MSNFFERAADHLEHIHREITHNVRGVQVYRDPWNTHVGVQSRYGDYYYSQQNYGGWRDLDYRNYGGGFSRGGYNDYGYGYSNYFDPYAGEERELRYAREQQRWAQSAIEEEHDLAEQRINLDVQQFETQWEAMRPVTTSTKAGSDARIAFRTARDASLEAFTNGDTERAIEIAEEYRDTHGANKGYASHRRSEYRDAPAITRQAPREESSEVDNLDAAFYNLEQRLDLRPGRETRLFREEVRNVALHNLREGYRNEAYQMFYDNGGRDEDFPRGMEPRREAPARSEQHNPPASFMADKLASETANITSQDETVVKTQLVEMMRANPKLFQQAMAEAGISPEPNAPAGGAVRDTGQIGTGPA